MVNLELKGESNDPEPVEGPKKDFRVIGGLFWLTILMVCASIMRGVRGSRQTCRCPSLRQRSGPSDFLLGHQKLAAFAVRSKWYN
jgi:hypothetical protein